MSKQRRTLAYSTFAAIMIFGVSVMASDRTDKDVLEAIWRSPDDSPAYFSDRFLNEIPSDKIRSILADLTGQCGAFIAVEETKKLAISV